MLDELEQLEQLEQVSLTSGGVAAEDVSYSDTCTCVLWDRCDCGVDSSVRARYAVRRLVGPAGQAGQAGDGWVGGMTKVLGRLGLHGLAGW